LTPDSGPTQPTDQDSNFVLSADSSESGGATRRLARAEAFVEAVLADLPLVAFDLLCARAHDLLTAASAIARGFSVATCDERSFRRIPGVEVEFHATT
jgi:predicted nucleic acid-binding protein